MDNEKQTNNKEDDSLKKIPVVDHYNLVYIILLLHGIAVLMPWNMFINAKEVCCCFVLIFGFDFWIFD